MRQLVGFKFVFIDQTELYGHDHPVGAISNGNVSGARAGLLGNQRAAKRNAGAEVMAVPA